MESIVSVNVANFITIGLMAIIFILLFRFVNAKTGNMIPVAV